MGNVMIAYSLRKTATLDCVPTGEKVNNYNIPCIKCVCAHVCGDMIQCFVTAYFVLGPSHDRENDFCNYS